MGMYHSLLACDILLTSREKIPSKKQTTLQWIQKDEATFDLDDMDRLERWQYYVSSFISLENTEGVHREGMTQSVLKKNLLQNAEPPKALVYKEDLEIRICMNTLKMLYKADSGDDYYIYTDKELGNYTGSPTLKRLEKVMSAKNEKFKENLEMNSKWMKDLSRDQVQEVNDNFKKWVKDGVLPGSAPPVASATPTTTEAVVDEAPQ